MQCRRAARGSGPEGRNGSSPSSQPGLGAGVGSTTAWGSGFGLQESLRSVCVKLGRSEEGDSRHRSAASLNCTAPASTLLPETNLRAREKKQSSD